MNGKLNPKTEKSGNQRGNKPLCDNLSGSPYFSFKYGNQ